MKNGGNVSPQLLWKLSEAFNGKFDNSDTIRIYDWGSSYYPDIHLVIPIFSDTEPRKTIMLGLSIREAEQFESYLLNAIKRAKEKELKCKI